MVRRPLRGSERDPLPNSRVLGPADPEERLEVTVLVRAADGQGLRDRLQRLAQGEGAAARLSRAQFARRHGAGRADLDAVRDFAESHGLAVVEEHSGRRTLVLAGTVAQFNDAFEVDLRRYSHPEGTYRGHPGPVQIPAELSGIVEAVLGLDNRPQARPHFRMKASAPGRRSRPARAGAAAFTPVQLASLYGFPPGDGKGECIALIELGGGYRPRDIQAYFAGLGLAAPAVTAVSVDHGANQPTGSPNGPDGEVMLDIEVAGAIAPAAAIAVYFAPNTDAGFLDAVTAAIHDDVRNPSVISISWGGPESTWTQQALAAMDQAFQAAAAMGITVCVAAGDGGSTDGAGDGNNHVDFPASSPHALACGGTSLQASGTTIVKEVAWNDGNPASGAGGGGVSAVFALPSWQQGLDITDAQRRRTPLAMRGVPDVAGDADPQTGYDVLVDGTRAVIGGTSAVAPLWAGLIARINSLTGRAAGLMSPALYGHSSALRDITQGDNGGFAASPGWDACTGLGSPDGSRVAAIPGL
ncbi:MAG: S8/S53 family peptidase [Proteobacteria bacterium]|nr:S8/S53 family peptidase [Pseudomonadota bacterium]